MEILIRRVIWVIHMQPPGSVSIKLEVTPPKISSSLVYWTEYRWPSAANEPHYFSQPSSYTYI